MNRRKVVRPSTTSVPRVKIESDREAVIREIRDARTRAGLTQEQAAGLRPNRATSTISRWESGGLPNNWDDLIEYAHALDQEIVLRFGPHKEEAAPPDWARRLLIVSEAARKKAGVTDAELELAEAYLVLIRLLGTNGGTPRGGGGGGGGVGAAGE